MELFIHFNKKKYNYEKIISYFDDHVYVWYFVG